MTGTYSIAYGGAPIYGGPDQTSLADSGVVQVMGGGMDWEPDPEPEAGRCHHRKVDGDFCGRYPKKGSLYCPLHKTADETIDLIDAALNED